MRILPLFALLSACGEHATDDPVKYLTEKDCDREHPCTIVDMDDEHATAASVIIKTSDDQRMLSAADDLVGAVNELSCNEDDPCKVWYSVNGSLNLTVELQKGEQSRTVHTSEPAVMPMPK